LDGDDAAHSQGKLCHAPESVHQNLLPFFKGTRLKDIAAKRQD
jgi:hypothetical protein